MRLPSDKSRSTLFDLMVAGWVLVLAPFSLGFTATAIIAPPMALALVFRRRWPLAVMAVVASAALVQVIIDGSPRGDPLPYDIAVPIAMYSVVKYGTRLRDGFLAGGVVAIGIVIEVVRHPDVPWWQEAVVYSAICSAVWLSGFVVRQRRAYLAGLEERAATLEREREHLAEIAVAHERATIAREMHDVVAHSLAVIIVQSDGGRYAMAQDPDKGRAVLKTVAETARDALEEMGRLIDLLRAGSGAAGTPDADEDPDADRRVWGLDRLDALVTRAREAGVDATLTLRPVPLVDNSTVGVAAYRLVQEALTNVLRHAGPTARCAVTVDGDEEAVRVTVVDDGGGRPHRRREAGARVGHGLVGMRERTAVLGGSLDAGPRAEGGWAVHAVLPIPPRERGTGRTRT